MYLLQNIEDWAIARGLATPSEADRTQLVKLGEEYGELCQGDLKQRREQVKDSIGDMYVVMTIYCLQHDIDFQECVQSAYDTIKNRKGKTVNGTFIKAEDMQNGVEQ